MSLSPALLALGASVGSAATEDLTQWPWWEWDCGKAAQDPKSAQAQLSVVVQGLRNQSQTGLSLLLCWEEELEEEGEGRDTEPWGCGGVGMNKTAQMELAQTCGCA